MDARGTLLFPLRGSVSGIRRRLLSVFGASSGRSARLIGDLIFYAVGKRGAKILRVFDNTRTVFLKSRRPRSVVSPLAEVSLSLSLSLSIVNIRSTRSRRALALSTTRDYAGFKLSSNKAIGSPVSFERSIRW
jgi:hypothetical protein